MHVNIMSYTTGAPRVMATVSLDKNGLLVVDGNPSDGVRQVVEDAHKRAKSAAAFLVTLPQQFTGSMIRARLVRGKP